MTIAAITLVNLLLQLYIIWKLRIIRRDQLAAITQMNRAESLRINSIASIAAMGDIARDENGRPLRRAKESQILRFEIVGGDNDDNPSGSRF